MKPNTMHIEQPRQGGYQIVDDDGHIYIWKATLREASEQLIKLWAEYNDGEEN